MLGAMRDLTGTFTGSLWLLVGFSLLMLGSVVALPRPSRSAVGEDPGAQELGLHLAPEGLSALCLVSCF